MAVVAFRKASPYRLVIQVSYGGGFDSTLLSNAALAAMCVEGPLKKWLLDNPTGVPSIGAASGSGQWDRPVRVFAETLADYQPRVAPQAGGLFVGGGGVGAGAAIVTLEYVHSHKANGAFALQIVRTFSSTTITRLDLINALPDGPFRRYLQSGINLLIKGNKKIKLRVYSRESWPNDQLRVVWGGDAVSFFCPSTMIPGTFHFEYVHSEDA